ncbi:MAG: hypothetical protein ACREQ8_17785 [Woeseiaceae bacterium]
MTHGNRYELQVYRVLETGEHRVYISKCGEGLEMLAFASAEVITDGKAFGADVLEILLQTARDEIDRNEWQKY